MKVIVTEIDDKGRVNVSHKEFAPKKEKKVEKAKVEETTEVKESTEEKPQE